MLTVATVLAPSPIHGLGCFAAVEIPAGAAVWVCDRRVDSWISERHLSRWEREHAYQSHTQEWDAWILPRDNAAFMNFAPEPNLVEGPLVDGEPTLVAVRTIAAGEELTVGVETDLDAFRKLGPSARSCFSFAESLQRMHPST